MDLRIALWLLAAGLVAACARSVTPRTGEDADAAMPASWPEQLQEISIEARDRFHAPTLSVAEYAARGPEVLLVDVRTEEEVRVSAIPGARSLPTREAREEFLEEHPGATVVVACTAGWRSAEFTRELQAAGIDAFNLEGGICAWAAAGREIVDAEGRPTRRIHSYSEDFARCVPDTHEAVVE